MTDLAPALLEAVLPTVRRAVATRTNLLLSGPPGTSKIMLARRLSSLMPPLSQRAARVLTVEYQIHRRFSGAQVFDPGDPRPFRAPHHTVSTAALAGFPFNRLGHPGDRVGEVALARHGVLLLDELPEFRIDAIDRLAVVLRTMTSSRPFVVATAVKCPCGWAGGGARTCQCASAAVARYSDRLHRLLAPLDITEHVDVPLVRPDGWG